MISAPSILVYLLESFTSAPLSDPAKSMNESLPKVFYYYFKVIDKIACDLDDSLLAPFTPVTLTLLPNSIIFIMVYTSVILFS